MLGKLAPFFGTAVLFFGIGVPHETVSARQMAPEYCRDLYFFGGHGLAEGGEDDWGPTVKNVYDNYEKGIHDADPDVSVDGEAIAYPRVEFPDWVRLVRARFSRQQEEEVIDGSIALNNQLTERYKACPGERFILVGYSEGAWVIHDYLKNLGAGALDRIAGVALLGDPQYVRTGIIPKLYPNHAIAPYFPPALQERAASWCVSYNLPAAKRTVFDPICHFSGPDVTNCLKATQGDIGESWCPHLRYVETGGTKRAADFLIGVS